MLISVTAWVQGEKEYAKDFLIAGCLLILSDKDYWQKKLCDFCKFVFRLNYPTAVLKLFSNCINFPSFSGGLNSSILIKWV